MSRKARVVAAAGEGAAEEVDWDAFVVRGTRTQLEKSYFRRAPQLPFLRHPLELPKAGSVSSHLGSPCMA